VWFIYNETTGQFEYNVKNGGWTALASGTLSSADIDTFAELDAIVADETLAKASDIGVTVQGYNANTDTDSTDDLTTSDLIDDDTFATATATNVPSAESVKAYADANSGDLWSDAVDSDIVPTAADVWDIGTPTDRFENGYIDRFNVEQLTGEVRFKQQSTSGFSGEGNVYYDTDDNRLALHDGTTGYRGLAYFDEIGSGSGDVTAASNFGTDNVLIRSDGTTKGVQSSQIVVGDLNTLSAPEWAISAPNGFGTEWSADSGFGPGTGRGAIKFIDGGTRFGDGSNSNNLKMTYGTLTALGVLDFTDSDITWKGTSLLSEVSQLSDLSDVNTSTATNRNVLVADGVDFESRALVEADISDLGTYIPTSDIIDEDDMSSDSATKVPTQQSVKAYVDINSGHISQGANTLTSDFSLLHSVGNGFVSDNDTKTTEVRGGETGVDRIRAYFGSDLFAIDFESNGAGIDYTLHESGVPTDATDLIDKAYADANYTSGSGDDVSGFSEKTGDLVGTDRLVGLSGATDFSETISNIPLSIFNDDLTHTTIEDDVFGAGWNGDTANGASQNALYDELIKKLNSVTSGEPSGSDAISNIVSLTQAEYEAGTPVAGTYYLITDPVTAEAIQIACSDLSTDVTTGTTKAYFRMPWAATLTDVKVSLLTAGTSTGLTVDINESGTTVLSTKLTTDATEETSTTAATAAVISDSALADDAEITIDFDAVPTGGQGVIVTLYVEH
jgi:hypothetical protein